MYVSQLEAKLWFFKELITRDPEILCKLAEFGRFGGLISLVNSIQLLWNKFGYSFKHHNPWINDSQ